MLPFGLKIVWFVLSISGLFSSWAAIPSFRRATNVLWIPLAYCAPNTVLQGIFCIGLVWRLNPLMMPHAFCLAQTTLIHVSWCCISGLNVAVTTMSAAVVLKDNGWLTRLASTVSYHVFLVIVFPLMILVAHSTTLYKLQAAQPTDGMNCDANNPIWVRLLGYSGASLVLSILSLILSLFSVVYIFCTKRHEVPLSAFPLHDSFTPLPPRRLHKRSTSAGAVLSQQRSPSPPQLARVEPPFTTLTPTTSYVLPSRSHTPAGTPFRFSQGRAKVIAKRSRYHLPFDWVSPDHTPTDTEDVQDTQPTTHTPESRLSYFSHATTPSPLIFASPSEVTYTSTRYVSRYASKGIPPALRANDEKDSTQGSSHSPGFTYDGHFFPIEDDAVSGSLKWARSSQDSSILKSELEFARSDEDIEDFPSTGRGSPLEQTSWHGGHPSHLHPAIWRIIIFQVFISLTQTLAAISSLIDIISRRPIPSPFGTQHVALLLTAWGPCLIFGVKLPWRHVR